MNNQKPFSQKVYDLISRIPSGKVSTYRLIARKLNSKAYRAVGQACKRNDYAPKIPCHRVVKSNGEIGGFAYGTKKKIEMLRKEGVEIIDRKVDLERYGFEF